MTDDVSKSDTQQKGPPSALTAVVELLLRKTMIMLLKGVLSRKPMNGVKARSLGFHGVCGIVWFYYTRCPFVHLNAENHLRVKALLCASCTLC